MHLYSVLRVCATQGTRAEVSLVLTTGPVRGQVGPNGIGKSTLLKTIFGDHEPTTGHVQLNNKLRIGRFTQHHADQLDMQKTPLEMLQKVATTHAGQSVPITALRSHLGQVS